MNDSTCSEWLEEGKKKMSGLDTLFSTITNFLKRNHTVGYVDKFPGTITGSL
jgi:hypothetical protein